MNTPLVSIVLPTYNGARFIRQSIDSCLRQTYTNFELIIVNDCSTDETPAIIEEYAKADARIKIIHNKVNKKLPGSLNIGFNAASGRYFTWTSDDNYYAPEAIASMVKVLEQNPQADIVYTDYYIIDDRDRILRVMHFNDVNESFHTWEGCGACFLYKREVHERNGGYDESAFLIEDYDFFLRAIMHSKFYYYKTHELYYYRHHAQSLTSTMAAAVFDVQKITVERRLPKLVKHLSRKDEMLLYRKYTVYYAVFKNNIHKTKYYLQHLYAMSRKQAFITVCYIAAKKTGNLFRISFGVFAYFVKLLFTKKRS